MAGGASSVVSHVLNMHKTLGLIPRTEKKKKLL
jgi:hypothetical protein